MHEVIERRAPCSVQSGTTPIRTSRKSPATQVCDPTLNYGKYVESVALAKCTIRVVKVLIAAQLSGRAAAYAGRARNI